MRRINHTILATLVTGTICASAQNSNWDARFATNGLDNIVRAIAVSGTDVYVGGYFTKAGDLTVNGIAKWDGNSWSALGTGVAGSNFVGRINAIAVHGTNVYVGGRFDRAGSVQVANFAKWDGVRWNKMYDADAGFDDEVFAIARAVNSPTIFVGGSFTKAGNNFGTAIPGHLAVGPGNWAAYGGAAPLGEQSVFYLATSWDSVYVGTDAGYRVIGGDPTDPYTLTGITVVRGFHRGYSAIILQSTGGYFHQRHQPIQFRATPLGMSVKDFALTGDELYVAGTFDRIQDSEPPNAVRVYANRIARFHNNTWSALGTGLDGGVNVIAANGNEVYVGGSFLNAGGKSSPYFAVWHAPEQSPRFSSVSLTPEQNAKLSILGRNGLDCRIDWSSTLTNWTTLVTSPNPEGAFEFTDATAAGVPHRFYRVVHP